MTGGPEGLWQTLKPMLDDALRLGPDVVAEARGQSGDSSALLAAAFDELRASIGAMDLKMADFAKTYRSPLEEAKASAAAAQERLKAAAARKAVSAPIPPQDLPGDLAPSYARQLLARYTPAVAAKVVNSSDSRVWFDASMVAQSRDSKSDASAVALSILAGVTSRVAVWWTCVCLSDALQSEWESMPAGERGVIERSVEWVLQPTLAARTSLAAHAATAATATIAEAIGALFCGIGARDPNLPAGDDVASAALLTLRLVCNRLTADVASEVMLRARQLACDMSEGKRLWTQVAGDASASVADSLATFSRWTDG